MPKLYTSNYPSSGYASEALMRSELQKIEDAFEDVVPRIQNIDSPQLQADIDMNNYDLLNVKNIDVQGLTLDGGTLQDEIEAGAQSVINEVEDRVVDAQVAAAAAQLARNVAEGYADDSAQLHEEAEIFRDQSQANAESVQSNLDSFNSIWHGVQGTEPTKEEANVGSLYFNDSDSQTYVCYAAAYLFGEIQQLYWRPIAVDENNLGSSAFVDFASREEAESFLIADKTITPETLNHVITERLNTPRIQWTSINPVGSVYKIHPGNSFEFYTDMDTLGEGRLVVFDSSDSNLRVLELVDEQWVDSGTTYNIPGAFGVQLASLSDTDIALYSYDDGNLYTLRYNGSWSQVGNALSVPTADEDGEMMTALSSNMIAKLDNNNNLQAYEFDGTNWYTVGNPLVLSFGGQNVYRASLDTLTEDRIVFCSCNNVLVCYEFDGIEWSQVGSQYDLPASSYTISVSSLNATDVVIMNTVDNKIQTYRFYESGWDKVGRSRSFTLSNGGEYIESCSVSGKEFVMFNTNLNGLQMYELDFAPNYNM